MKYFKLSFLLLLFIPFIHIKAQDRNETVKLLSRKWQAIQMVSGERKMNIAPDGDYTTFKEDFTSEQKQDAHVNKSTWSYVEAEKKIVFGSGDTYILKEVTATKLVLAQKMEGKEVNIIFKPFK